MILLYRWFANSVQQCTNHNTLFPKRNTPFHVAFLLKESVLHNYKVCGHQPFVAAYAGIMVDIGGVLKV